MKPNECIKLFDDKGVHRLTVTQPTDSTVEFSAPDRRVLGWDYQIPDWLSGFPIRPINPCIMCNGERSLRDTIQHGSFSMPTRKTCPRCNGTGFEPKKEFP